MVNEVIIQRVLVCVLGGGGGGGGGGGSEFIRSYGGSLFIIMALANPVHSITNGSRTKRQNLWVGRVSSSWRP